MAVYPTPGLRNRTCIIAGLLSLSAGVAQASSFALIEQSVSGMGSAYAIGAAGLDDASTLYFNPAGMSRLSGSNLSTGLQIVSSSVDINASAEYNANNPALGPLGLDIAGDPINGSGSTNTDLVAGVPAGYITHQYSDRLWAGFAVNAHFGLETDYDANWVGRYHAIKSELLTLDFNPSLAFKVNDSATVALGISALYADGRLTNAIDGGLADNLNDNFIQGVSAPLCAEDPCPWDLNATLEGDDWGFGFNFGILLEPSDNTRLGLHYRSKIELDIEGDITLSHLAFPAPQVQGAKLPLTLPGSLSVSGYHALNSQWAVMADLTWTEWSRVQNVDITLASGSQSNNAWKYDDSTRIAIGTEYKHSADWTYRAGVALDKTPVPSDVDR
ncbi:MAG: outer membrane protein transport protein, partial [Gammaproteobacteria bacterium]|nr:outer membrane protein transport protein [Gammaproteobacteria bacterium]